MPPESRLADTLNKYFRIGCTKFTRHELLAYAGTDRNRVEEYLQFWQSRGWLKLLKSLSEARDSEIVVNMVSPIPTEARDERERKADGCLHNGEALRAQDRV